MSKKLRQSDAKDIDQPVIKTDIDGHITYLILIETMDGLYTPIGLELPDGEGPFPVVLLASGNGGEGMKWIEENTKNRRFTINKLLEQGYACGWIVTEQRLNLGIMMAVN